MTEWARESGPRARMSGCVEAIVLGPVRWQARYAVRVGSPVWVACVRPRATCTSVDAHGSPEGSRHPVHAYDSPWKRYCAPC
jgi:hypothetical protein